VTDQLGLTFGFDYGMQPKAKGNGDKNENLVNNNAALTASIVISF
jgi:hypothetical protein